MTTEQRLERLERENRWMRRIGAVGVAVAAVVFLMAQGKEKEPQDLEVRSLKVKDADGKVRAYLGPHAHGQPALRLKDQNGMERARLYTEPDGSPALNLMDKDGIIRVGLWMRDRRVRRDGANGSPEVILKDKTGQSRVTATENTLTLLDANGKVIWKAPKD